MKTKPENILQQPDPGNAGGGKRETKGTPVHPESFFAARETPFRTGYPFYTDLKKLEQLQHSVFVMYSTHISDNNRKEALRLGAFCCIPKPENIKILLKQLQHLLSDKTHLS